MKPLSKRQGETLHAIAKIWKAGRPPTTGELLAELKLASVGGLCPLLDQVSDKGYITVRGGVRGRQRHIELTSLGRAFSGFGIPVLGEIPAGPLAEAIQECGEWVDSFGSLIKTRSSDFALRVKGDSMIGDGILSGDRVLLRPGIEWRPGEIVAAQIHGEDESIYQGTLKHIDLLEDGKTVRLRASNPLYPDMMFDACAVTVAGVYRGLMRPIE